MKGMSLVLFVAIAVAVLVEETRQEDDKSGRLIRRQFSGACKICASGEHLAEEKAIESNGVSNEVCNNRCVQCPKPTI
ncbi:hypothetical protein CHUAL_009877 [Chamberlinius hualienensis]